MNKKQVRRALACLAVFTAQFLGTVPRGLAAETPKVIGILVWSEESRYTLAKDAIVEQLKKEGFVEPKARYLIENADGNRAKVVKITQDFIAQKVDIIIPLGTSAATGVAKEVKDIPIVFSTVYDPVGSKIAKDWASSGNNTTGSSSNVKIAKLFMHVKSIAPVKNVAVLYTPGQANSELQLKSAEAAQEEAGIKIVPVALTTKEEVPVVLSHVIQKCEAMYLTGSSIVGDTLPTIIDLTSKAKIITFSHLDDIVEKGALLGLAANHVELAKLAATKAAKVLRGAKPSSIPIEPLKNLDVIINMKTLKATGIELPAEFRKLITKTIE